jgi:hypothetical protein
MNRASAHAAGRRAFLTACHPPLEPHPAVTGFLVSLGLTEKH